MRRCAILTCLLLATPARADDADAARRAFEAGVALEAKHDYAAALERFKESAQSKKTLSNRFHQAYCLEMIGKLAGALAEYEAIESEAQQVNRSDILQSTNTRLEGLRARVPQLTLRVAPAVDDAEVLLDGSRVATLDGHALRIDPGEHVVTARAARFEPFEKRFTLAEGAAENIIVSLRATPEAAPVQEVRATREQVPSRTLPILTTGGAVAFLAGGLVSFVAADSAQTDAKKRCLGRLPPCDDDRSTIRAFDTLALVGFVGAAGLGALSVVLWSRRRTNVAVRGPWLGVQGTF